MIRIGQRRSCNLYIITTDHSYDQVLQATTAKKMISIIAAYTGTTTCRRRRPGAGAAVRKSCGWNRESIDSVRFGYLWLLYEIGELAYEPNSNIENKTLNLPPRIQRIVPIGCYTPTSNKPGANITSSNARLEVFGGRPNFHREHRRNTEPGRFVPEPPNPPYNHQGFRPEPRREWAPYP